LSHLFYQRSADPPDLHSFPTRTLFRSSEMLGYTTLRRRSLTRGRRRRDVSRSQSEERRALMLPQELKAMGSEREILFCEGMAHADRKSTRLNSSHVKISYAVFCLKKKK